MAVSRQRQAHESQGRGSRGFSGLHLVVVSVLGMAVGSGACLLAALVCLRKRLHFPFLHSSSSPAPAFPRLESIANIYARPVQFSPSQQLNLLSTVDKQLFTSHPIQLTLASDQNILSLRQQLSHETLSQCMDNNFMACSEKYKIKDRCKHESVSESCALLQDPTSASQNDSDSPRKASQRHSDLTFDLSPSFRPLHSPCGSAASAVISNDLDQVTADRSPGSCRSRSSSRNCHRGNHGTNSAGNMSRWSSYGDSDSNAPVTPDGDEMGMRRTVHNNTSLNSRNNVRGSRRHHRHHHHRHQTPHLHQQLGQRSSFNRL